jgi:hypothetical protein
MTMPFSTAAAALDATAVPDHGVYSYSTEVEFLMKTTASHAPAILSLILAKLVLDEPTIIFNDADNNRINESELPTEKSSFDATLSTTSSAGRLSCRFEIKSDRHSFHPIKMGVWDILQKHGVYFKKSATPVKKYHCRRSASGSTYTQVSPVLTYSTPKFARVFSYRTPPTRPF